MPCLLLSIITLSKVCDILIDANTQTNGVNVNISLTITPAKYTADTAYSTTVIILIIS